MAPYSFDEQWEMDSDNSGDSESEENRMETKSRRGKLKCKYCSKPFYHRCWDHSKEAEEALVKKCETFHDHNCTHNFKCEGCHTKFVSQDILDHHWCAEKYQCDVCLKRFPSIDKVNGGKHHFRRKKKLVNCTNFVVRVSKNGFRIINIKTEKDRAKERAKKEQEKAANRKAKKRVKKKRSEEAKKKENKENMVWSNMVWSNDIVWSNNTMWPKTSLYQNIF